MKKRYWIIVAFPVICLAFIIGVYGKLNKPDEITQGVQSLELLKALPYLSFSEEKANKSLSGVILYDQERSAEGFNFLVNNKWKGITSLMDMEGNILWSWPGMMFAKLLKNGLISANFRNKLGLYRLNSEAVWMIDSPTHHEVTLTPDNTIIYFNKKLMEYKGREHVIFDNIIESTPEGEEIFRWETWDNLDKIRQFHYPSKLDTTFDSDKEDRKEHYDYYHLNSLQILPDNPLGQIDKRFQRGNWLISLRNADLVLILDRDTKEIVWDYGPGEIVRQHMPRMLENGNIMIYDNGVRRPTKLNRAYSRIIEVNPITEEIVWEYRGSEDKPFFSILSGSAQRLSNGNTLIMESNNGRAFEVTREGDIVWEWYNPTINKQGQRAIVYRMIRYSEEEIAQLLKEIRAIPAPVPTPPQQ